MNETVGAKPTVFLRDYRPPAWRVGTVELEVDLDADATFVTSRLQLQQAQAGAELRLDAIALELLEVRVDGRALEPGEYRQDDTSLVLPGVRGDATVETRVRIAPARN